MKRPAMFVLAVVAFALAAYRAGTWWSAEARPPAPATAPRVVERVVLRAASPSPPPEPVRAPEVEAAPVGEPDRAPAAAIELVEAGLRDGAWSASERDALRMVLVDLQPAEIDQVLGPLFQAINAQRVRVDGSPI